MTEATVAYRKCTYCDHRAGYLAQFDADDGGIYEVDMCACCVRPHRMRDATRTS